MILYELINPQLQIIVLKPFLPSYNHLICYNKLREQFLFLLAIDVD